MEAKELIEQEYQTSKNKIENIKKNIEEEKSKSKRQKGYIELLYHELTKELIKANCLADLKLKVMESENKELKQETEETIKNILGKENE